MKFFPIFGFDVDFLAVLFYFLSQMTSFVALFFWLFIASPASFGHDVNPESVRLRESVESLRESVKAIREAMKGIRLEREKLFSILKTFNIYPTKENHYVERGNIAQKDLPAQIQQDAIRSLIIIYNGKKERQATGFLISPTQLVTVYHLIRGREESLKHGSSKMLISGTKGHFDFKKIIAFSKNHDIALIEVKRTDTGDTEVPFLKLSSKDPLKEDIVYTLGYGGGILKKLRSRVAIIEKKWSFNHSRSSGFQIEKTPHEFSSAERAQIENLTKRQFKILNTILEIGWFVPVLYSESKGMSGSPVMNDRGEVIGLYRAVIHFDYKKVGIDFYFGDYITSISHLKELQN